MDAFFYDLPHEVSDGSQERMASRLAVSQQTTFLFTKNARTGKFGKY
jgi:hypothetical protein